MKITLTINGKHVEAEVDEKAIREATEEKKKTGYEYEKYELGSYYSQAQDGSISDYVKPNTMLSAHFDRLYMTANLYSDKKVAENNARADALMRKLRRFAAEHGGCVAPKNAGWEIEYVRKDGLLIAHFFSQVISHGIILFSTKEVAEKAIKEFKGDLLWYFTEYDPIPEGWWEN